jgi:hypothetical protein
MIEKEQIYVKPTRKLLDLTFWLGHICIIAALMITVKSHDPQEISTLTLSLSAVGSFTLIAYFFAMGQFAKRTGRSAIVWFGVPLIFSPLGIWVSYIASFFIKAKNP